MGNQIYNNKGENRKMNFKTTLCVFVLTAVILSIDCSKKDKESTDVSNKIEPATTTLIVTALAPVVINALTGLFQHLTKPSDTQDTIIFGRSMRLKICNEEATCVQLTDRASGLSEVGTGSNTQEATGDATKKLFDDLLTKNILSLHDLCDLHIFFPHPDQNTCPGVQINPCDLIHPVATTPVPCHDKHGSKYCQRNKKKCDEPVYHTFMREQCLYTCSGGTCSFDNKPVNPCVLSF